MKHTSNKKNHKNIFRTLLLIASFVMVSLIPLRSLAQADSTAPAAVAEQEAPPAVDMISPSIEFTSVQKGDLGIDLKAAVKAKINGTLTKLYGLKIKFYLVTADGDSELGAAVTDRNGVAIYNFKSDSAKSDAEGKLNFKAVFAGNKSAESAEEVLAIKRAKLIVTPVKEDAVYTFQVKLVDMATGTETPVPETALGVFVKRTFNPLKIGEGTTDENGEISVEIPHDLPGDAKGNITLMAKLEENETYGNMEATVVQPWGKPVSYEIRELPRALWSPHPPLWMLITFIVLMVVVWGHYLVIVYELFRLRREQP